MILVLIAGCGVDLSALVGRRIVLCEGWCESDVASRLAGRMGWHFYIFSGSSERRLPVMSHVKSHAQIILVDSLVLRGK